MEKKTALSEEKKQWLIVAAIMLVGILVRLLLVGRYPAGLNQDEASAGYDAFAVLNYGIDRNGIHNPMHLIAWGSGQNMAYSWLCMPFIALFGLSAVTVRVPMAIVGSISVALFYFFLKNIRGEDKRLVYLGTFLFAVFPWHIMKSRWGLESNLFPDLILWGVVLLSFFLKNRKGIFLYLGYFLFGFSAYAYGSAYCFLPFFVLPLTVYLYCTKRAELKQLFLAMLILAVVVLPVLVFLFINTFDYPQIDLGLFTIPRLYANRHTEMASVFSGDFLAKSWRNFTGALKILAVQDDGLPWNAIRYFGLTYPITLPLTLWWRIPDGFLAAVFCGFAVCGGAEHQPNQYHYDPLDVLYRRRDDGAGPEYSGRCQDCGSRIWGFLSAVCRDVFYTLPGYDRLFVLRGPGQCHCALLSGECIPDLRNG